MFRFINSKYKKYKTAVFDKEKHIAGHYLDSDGNAVIRIHLNKVEDVFSEFCAEGYEELSGDFADYIDGVIYHIPLENAVILHFDIDQATKDQEMLLRQVISDHYGLVLEDKRLDLRINLLTIFGLFVVGVALLAFSYYLSSNEKGQLFTDIINIAGTFGLWEMVDLYLLDRKLKKIEELNAAQTAMAKIVFKN